MRRLIPWTLATATLLGPVIGQGRAGDGLTPPAPEQVLAGNLRLLESGTGELLDGLEAQGIAALAEIYPDVVLTYGDIANQLERAFERHGAAAERIQLARNVLDKIGTDEAEESVNQQRLDVLTEGVRTARAELSDELSRLRNGFDDDLDAGTRRRVLGEMALLSERIEQLDAILDSKQEAAEAGFTAAELAQPLAALDGQLQRERQLLLVQAQAVAELMGSANRQMEKALDFLVVETEIPYELLRELRDVRSGLRQLVGRLDCLREATRAEVVSSAGRSPIAGMPGLDAADEQLLSRVDELLGNGPAD